MFPQSALSHLGFQCSGLTIPDQTIIVFKIARTTVVHPPVHIIRTKTAKRWSSILIIGSCSNLMGISRKLVLLPFRHTLRHGAGSCSRCYDRSVLSDHQPLMDLSRGLKVCCCCAGWNRSITGAMVGGFVMGFWKPW